MKNPPEPVAETYRELQSLDRISEFHSFLANNLDSRQRTDCVLAGCIELVLRGCVDLCQRKVNLLQINKEKYASFALLSHYYEWHSEMLTLALDIATLRQYVSTHHVATSDSILYKFDFYSSALADLSSVILEKIKSQEKQILNGVDTGRSTNIFASIQHHAKRTAHLYFCLQARLGAMLPSKALNHFPLLAEAVSELSIRRDTFFTQFRVLHQVPELLALEGLLIKSKILSDLETGNHSPHSIHETTSSLRLLNEITSLIVCSLSPIARSLYPIDYKHIRRNLGKTSGSQSESLAKRLFNSDILELIKKIDEFCDRQHPAENKDFLSEMRGTTRRIATTISLWRDLHLHFPRNVLGGGGTVSLIGVSDAIRSAEHMKSAFLSHCKHTGFEPCASKAREIGSTTKLEELDNYLLEMTGQVVRGWFPDVQNRTGRYKR